MMAMPTVLMLPDVFANNPSFLKTEAPVPIAMFTLPARSNTPPVW